VPIPRSLRRRLDLPSRVALTLGLGALSVASARAITPGDNEHQSASDALVRSEGGRIFLSEGGRETELQLGPTPQRDHLLQLLEVQGLAGIKLNIDPRLIMSGGGGTGFSLWDIKKSVTGTPAPTPQNPPQVTAPPSPSEKGLTPRRHNPATDKKG
jgi:hypothetical protein